MTCDFVNFKNIKILLDEDKKNPRFIENEDFVNIVERAYKFSNC